MELFMVDRRGIYSTGDIVTPKKFADISPVEMSSLVDKLFPCGLAPQGERYFINNAAKFILKANSSTGGLSFTEEESSRKNLLAIRHSSPGIPQRKPNIFDLQTGNHQIKFSQYKQIVTIVEICHY
ncbi:hypothetical protein F8X31_01390 [Salmonella enterica]|nr:hypothetical protein [Salmonella enterica]